ncbi:hypothetical protein E2C01_076285 [Portunus trituberculatus]|uniref:Uncharacterized protein n=1 Tax=Portunus trituberculatus TaxID=210409 RepID=A0A5B7II60_PORTR|nr:hypothetical protein [Portunus trituberculatus]
MGPINTHLRCVVNRAARETAGRGHCAPFCEATTPSCSGGRHNTGGLLVLHMCPWLRRPTPGLPPQRGMQTAEEGGPTHAQAGAGPGLVGDGPGLGQSLAEAEGWPAHAGAETELGVILTGNFLSHLLLKQLL